MCCFWCFLTLFFQFFLHLLAWIGIVLCCVVFCCIVLYVGDYAMRVVYILVLLSSYSTKEEEELKIKRLRPRQLFSSFLWKGGSKLCARTSFCLCKHYALECANMNAHNSIQCHLMEFVCVCLSVCIYFIVNKSIGISWNVCLRVWSLFILLNVMSTLCEFLTSFILTYSSRARDTNGLLTSLQHVWKHI